MQNHWGRDDGDAGDSWETRVAYSLLEPTSALHDTPGAIADELRRVLTRAGIDPSLEGPDLQVALHRAIALHRYSCSWTKVHVGWVVTLEFPEQRRFFGQTLEEALAWCLARVMAGETRHPRSVTRK